MDEQVKNEYYVSLVFGHQYMKQRNSIRMGLSTPRAYISVAFSG